MRIAVIPARGGSKRIPRKNIKIFCGKPMIAWSISVAIESGLFDRIFVSTDDTEIAKVAIEWGAEAPFLRPPELSGDFTGTTEVMAHATKWAQNQGWKLDAVCCIYATAPLIQIKDLMQGLSLLETGAWDYAFPVAEFSAPIFRAFKCNEYGGVEMFFPEHFETRSQDLPIAFHDAGQFYWGRPIAWMESRRIFSRHSALVKLPSWRVQDIDNWDDWLRAEFLFNKLGEMKNGSE